MKTIKIRKDIISNAEGSRETKGLLTALISHTMMRVGVACTEPIHHGDDQSLLILKAHTPKTRLQQTVGTKNN